MPRESLPALKLEDVSISAGGSGARMGHVSGVGAWWPGLVPFVSHRPGTYGRLLLAVHRHLLQPTFYGGVAIKTTHSYSNIPIC